MEFNTKSAIIVGEFVNLLGIFNYAIYDVNKDNKVNSQDLFKIIEYIENN